MWVAYLLKLPKKLYEWLVEISEETGETMAYHIRQALRDYKSKNEKK